MVKSDLSWIVVTDMEKARKFFKEVVGLEEHSYNEAYGWAELKGESGATLGIARENADMSAGKNAIMTFTVDDIAKSCEEYKAKGVNLVGDVVEVPGHVKMQMFTDHDGNLFQIVEVLG